MAADRPGDFGSKLREARERKGASLRQIASQTKISVSALEALERNDISRLPGGIFSRAFVRSYAAEIGLDPDTAIQDFVAQFPQEAASAAAHTASKQNEENETIESERQAASTVLWIVLISVPLAGGLFYLNARNRPPAAPAVTAPTAAPPPLANAAAAAPAALPASASSQPPPSTSPAEPAPAASATVDAGAAAEHVTVGLTAKRPVWVSATVDGRKAIERLLQPGDRQTLEMTREMLLTTGDASALTMTLNGVEARTLGRTGEVMTTRLTPSNFRDFLPTR
jgi:cytoskeletal protein RodZ